MPSPFPGMDPYLEGYLWPDVHHRLATEISRQLAPRLRPRYVVRIEIMVVQDETPEAEIGIMYPDAEVLKVDRPEPLLAAGGRTATTTVSPALLEVPILKPEVRLHSVHIRDVGENQLVTSIEILSPVNKREPGLAAYREKRERLHAAGIHLLELDLLRRGTRPFQHPRIPPTAYLITWTLAIFSSTRGRIASNLATLPRGRDGFRQSPVITLIQAGRNVAQLWPVPLAEPLPVLPVPLRAPDPDVPLDLGQAIRAIYDEAAYDLSIDYTQPPPPPALEDEQQWMDTLLRKNRE